MSETHSKFNPHFSYAVHFNIISFSLPARTSSLNIAIGGSHLSSQLHAKESIGLRRGERCCLEAEHGGRLLKQRTLLLLLRLRLS
jgi:hypothetical protein